MEDFKTYILFVDNEAFDIDGGDVIANNFDRGEQIYPIKLKVRKCYAQY